ncbi:hypothetical protein [Streptomyces sp. NPDC055060]
MKKRRDRGEPAKWAPIEAGFRGLARLRGAPALHPLGLTCTAELDVLAASGT